MLEQIKNAIKAANSRRKTVYELQALSDRELHDIGINRADIHRVARRVDPLV